MEKYDLNRFIKAQEEFYDVALEEVRSGYKRSHWMWYIFPQLQGLGESTTSNDYGIHGIEEAREYLQNDVLRSHLLEISQALLDLQLTNIFEVFNYPDDLKLKSSMTLFHCVEPDNEIFKKILEEFYDGELDYLTLDLLGFSNEMMNHHYIKV